MFHTLQVPRGLTKRYPIAPANATAHNPAGKVALDSKTTHARMLRLAGGHFNGQSI